MILFFDTSALVKVFHEEKGWLGRIAMKWKEIVNKFRDEWVLIDAKEVDKNYKLKEGDVIAHSKDKSEIYERLLKLKGKNLYIEYTGKIPEDLAVVLCHQPGSSGEKTANNYRQRL